MIISGRTTTRVARTMERACTSQLVMVIGLTGVQFCNHTIGLLLQAELDHMNYS